MFQQTDYHIQLGAMSSSSHLVPEQGNSEEAVAIIKAYPQCIDPQSWSADPEQACIRHMQFLTAFLQKERKKAEIKNLFLQANKRLSASEGKLIANCVVEVKKWLVKKWKNLKSGQKTQPAILALMHSLFGPKPGQSHGNANAKPAQGNAKKNDCDEDKGIKRRHSFKSPPEKKQSPIIVKELEDEQHASPASCPASCLEISSEEKASATESLGKASASYASVVAPEEIAAAKPFKGPVMKKPETKTKKKQNKKGRKACTRQKPAAVQVGGPGTWKASVSFGWLKPTMAKDKAYIQARTDKQSKVYCLVNVALPKGPEQSKVMEALMGMAQTKQGLDKAELVKHKNGLLKKA